MNSKLPKQKEAFLKDIAAVMEKHKVDHVLCIYSMAGMVHNSYLHGGNVQSAKMYENLSDGIDAWMSQPITN